MLAAFQHDEREQLYNFDARQHEATPQQHYGLDLDYAQYPAFYT